MPARAHFGVPKFTYQTALHFAAQLRRHRLHAVADAQHRHAEFKDNFRRTRGVCLDDRGVAAGKNDAFRLKGADLGVRHIEGMQFAVHAGFTYAARDELGDLRAKIKDEDFIGGVFHGFRSQRF